MYCISWPLLSEASGLKNFCHHAIMDHLNCVDYSATPTPTFFVQLLIDNFFPNNQTKFCVNIRQYTHISSVADPETLERGQRNMKYKPLCTAAIFFGLFFTGQGGHGPFDPPPWIRYCSSIFILMPQ